MNSEMNSQANPQTNSEEANPEVSSPVTFGKLFVKGSLGAGFATLLFQIFYQMVLEPEIDVPGTVLFSLVIGVIYGCYFAIFHRKRVVTGLSSFACGLLTAVTSCCGLLTWATLTEEEVSLSLNTLFTMIELALVCGLGGDVFSQVSVRVTYTKE